MKMPPVKQDYYPMVGGLDLETPAIAMKPGKCLDAMNYEPEISGGYRRIDGYERYSGKTSPSSATYSTMTATLTGTVAVGDTITGLTSSATAKVLQTGSTLILGRVSGTFEAGESIQVSAVTVGTATSTATDRGATSQSDDADYMLLAANDRRADIAAVPGSGIIRGVWIYNDTVYAFRDNAGGTAGDMYKATASGWSKITFTSEIQFTTATAQISAGDTITGATSGATALVVKAMLRTGTWTVSGTGTLIISTITGTWQNGEGIKVGGVSNATSSSLATAIARAPGGRVECRNHNFTGSTLTKKMYGADGVNKAFEFDGANYIPIRTGMATDTPSHIVCHKNYLFLSFNASVQYSAIGDPYAWTAVLGAGELAVSDSVSGFLPQTGDANGSSLAIFSGSGRTTILYGSSSADFKLVPSNGDIGFVPYTMQQVSNDAYGITSRGIQALITTLNYGNFDYASISHNINPLLKRKFGTECESTTIKGKNQYRVFFTDGTAIVVGLTGNKVNGMMPLDYTIPVRVMVTDTLSTGEEVTFFGSDDGYIYQDRKGTSFDGNVIEAFIRPAFNNLSSPQLRKRYRRAIFEVATEGFSQVKVTYDLGYGSAAVNPSVESDQQMVGSGGYWDSFSWDEFSWDAQIFSNPSISIAGTEKNIGFFFYSRRAQDTPHTIQGVTLMWTPRRNER